MLKRKLQLEIYSDEEEELQEQFSHREPSQQPQIEEAPLSAKDNAWSDDEKHF